MYSGELKIYIANFLCERSGAFLVCLHHVYAAKSERVHFWRHRSESNLKHWATTGFADLAVNNGSRKDLRISAPSDGLIYALPASFSSILIMLPISGFAGWDLIAGHNSLNQRRERESDKIRPRVARPDLGSMSRSDQHTETRSLLISARNQGGSDRQRAGSRGRLDT
jgi:hypothetical protein